MTFHTVKVFIHTVTCHCILVLFHTKTCHFILATTCFIRIRNVSYVQVLFHTFENLFHIYRYCFICAHVISSYHTYIYCFIPTHVISDEICVTNLIVRAFINNSCNWSSFRMLLCNVLRCSVFIPPHRMAVTGTYIEIGCDSLGCGVTNM